MDAPPRAGREAGSSDERVLRVQLFHTCYPSKSHRLTTGTMLALTGQDRTPSQAGRTEPGTGHARGGGGWWTAGGLGEREGLCRAEDPRVSDLGKSRRSEVAGEVSPKLRVQDTSRCCLQGTVAVTLGSGQLRKCLPAAPKQNKPLLGGRSESSARARVLLIIAFDLMKA